LASCADDGSVHVWEEQGEGAGIRDYLINKYLYVCMNKRCIIFLSEVVNPGEDRARGRWQRKAQLSDSKKSVNAVQFAPRHLGLKLAAASADGTVRIYEASDVFSLNYWPLQVSCSIMVLRASITS
jgi:nucleoporin SEH1